MFFLLILTLRMIPVLFSLAPGLRHTINYWLYDTGLEGWRAIGCWEPLDYPCRQAFDVTECHALCSWRPQSRPSLSLGPCTVTSPPAKQQSWNKTTSVQHPPAKCQQHPEAQTRAGTSHHEAPQSPQVLKLWSSHHTQRWTGPREQLPHQILRSSSSSHSEGAQHSNWSRSSLLWWYPFFKS